MRAPFLSMVRSNAGGVAPLRRDDCYGDFGRVAPGARLVRLTEEQA